MASNLVKKIKMNKPELPVYNVSFIGERDRRKFINRVEKIVRGSMEYKDYIKYLKEFIELNSCLFLKKVTNTNTNGKTTHVSIEIHHEPLTLYDIVEIVLTKHEDSGIPINDLLIADEVMRAHYENMIGLVPLSKTVHEIIHNSDKLFIPLHMVYGEVSKFLESYDQWISDEIYEKIEKKSEKSRSMTPDQFDAMTQELKILDIKGYDEIEKLDIQNDEEKEAITNEYLLNNTSAA